MPTHPLTDAKANLSALVDELQRTHEPVTITRHGKVAAVLIAPEDLATLMETLEWLADPGHAAELNEGVEAIERGHTMSLDEVRRELGA